MYVVNNRLYEERIISTFIFDTLSELDTNIKATNIDNPVHINIYQHTSNSY